MDTLLAIYPTARKVEELLKEQSRGRCRLGHRMMTFPQLVDGLWRECGRNRVLLSPLGERLALDEAAKDTRILGTPLSSAVGLVNHVIELIHQFKSAALESDDLLRAGSSGLPGDATARVSALARLFADYESLLRERGLGDMHDRERIVLQALHEMEAKGRRPRFLEGVEQLLVAEIYDFSLVQFMIVAALIRLIGDARLTIQAEPRSVDAANFAQLTWNRFVEEESIADKVLPDFVRRSGRPGQLGFVLEHIFTPDSAAAPPADGTVRIIEAATRHREVEEVGRAIRRALERPFSERIALERIAIIARDLTPYAEYIRTVFRRYRIPVRLRHGLPLRATALAKLALDILNIPLEDYRRERLKSLLSSPHARIRAVDCQSLLDDGGYIDRKTRPLNECIAKRRREIADALASFTSDDGGRKPLEAALAYIERGAGAFDDLLATLRTLECPGTLAEHVHRLGEVFRRLRIDPVADSPSSDAARAFSALCNTLGELAREAEPIAPHRSLSLEEFAEIVESALSETTLDDESCERAGGVQGLSVLDARGLDFDLVFILGLNDGTFPLYHPDDPILPDEIRTILNRPLAAALRRRLGEHAPSALNKILRTRYDRNGEDAFLFFLALSMPEREVVLSYTTADENGNPLRRSPFVDAVVNLLGGASQAGGLMLRVSAEDFIPAAEDCYSPGEFLNCAASRSALHRDWAAAIAGDEAARSIAERIEIERRRERYLELPAREDLGDGVADERKLALAGPYDGRVVADARLRRMLLGTPATPRRWSPGQLSEFAACGFKFFAGRVLRLHEQDEPDYAESALETGRMVHAVLSGLLSLPIDFCDRARALAQGREFLKTAYAQKRAAARDPAFFDITWRGIERMVEEVVEFEVERRAETPDMRPESKLEHPFAFTLRDHRGLPPDGRVDVALEGRLDRLELYRNSSGRIESVNVLDYKTSRHVGDYAKLADPEKDFGTADFQLPVYVMGALAEFAAELAPEVALDAGYLVLRNRDKYQHAPIPRELVEIDPVRRATLGAQGRPSKADRVIEMVSAALGGQFDIDPLKCDDFCPFRRICRYYKPETAMR